MRCNISAYLAVRKAFQSGIPQFLDGSLSKIHQPTRETLSRSGDHPDMVYYSDALIGSFLNVIPRINGCKQKSNVIFC